MFEYLEIICTSQTDDLAELADLVAPGDTVFFNGAEFMGADLRGTDLSRFTLVGATFVGAKIDSTTRIPDSIPLSSYDRDDDSLAQATRRVDELIEGISKNIDPIISSIKKGLSQNDDNQPRNIRRRGNSNYVPSHSLKKPELSSAITLNNFNNSIIKLVRDRNTFSQKQLVDVINKLHKIKEICARFAAIESLVVDESEDIRPANKVDPLQNEQLLDFGRSIYIDNAVTIIDGRNNWDERLSDLISQLLRNVKIDRNANVAGDWLRLRNEYSKTIDELEKIHAIIANHNTVEHVKNGAQ